MAHGFDQPATYVVKPNFVLDDDEPAEADVTTLNAQQRFKAFLKTYHVGGFEHPYRDELKRRYTLGNYQLEVRMDDLRSFDDDLEDQLKTKPSVFLPLFENAAQAVADELTRPRLPDEETMHEIQITLSSPNQHPLTIRELMSGQVSRLVKLSGIIIAASQVRSKAQSICIQCRNCHQAQSDIRLKPGLEGYVLPRNCPFSDQAVQGQKCPVDPFFIVADKCKCVDFQVLKLQENPEDVPHGELPRHLQLYCDRNLTDLVTPGNRVTVFGIYSIKKTGKSFKKGGNDKVNPGIRSAYLRCVGIKVESSGPGTAHGGNAFTADEEQEFRSLSKERDLHDRIARSIAPSIFGSDDIKKAIACLLFGGSRKKLPDGLTRRGDINVLLIGDPGTAKSQLLKFVEKVAPIAVYTSGKGSSAAGLTASVLRDPSTRGFVMEGGAMVLADGGVVCIDEFDKMREDDRVAIHEAMEQQTISIAKAGITTTLNSRCAVFAAANSIFGRWDDTKGEENIDFMPTILSRFDMIFLVKDEHDERRDITLAKHVINVHMNAHSQDAGMDKGELSLDKLKKYIAYCKANCGPRLSAEAAEILTSKYVHMRGDSFSHEKGVGHKSTIPITVRQLEAIVRISESLAKMQLSSFAQEHHVKEAVRLFEVSTLAAAGSGSLAGVEGFTTAEDQDVISRIEKQLKKRFAIGTQVSEHAIMQDFLRQNYQEQTVRRVLYCMIRRGEIQHRLERKMLFRIK